jgi:hypothetical protein
MDNYVTKSQSPLVFGREKLQPNLSIRCNKGDKKGTRQEKRCDVKNDKVQMHKNARKQSWKQNTSKILKWELY